MLDGYRNDLERHLARPDPPPCKACDGWGYVIAPDGDRDTTICGVCEGTGDRPDPAPPLREEEGPHE